MNASTVNRWLNYSTRPGKAETVLQIADALQIESVAERRALLEAAGYHYAAREVQEDEAAGVFGGERGIEPATPEAEASPATANLVKVGRFGVPPQIQDFVGRRELIEDIKPVLLAGGQICILRGMGGVGKTAVAVHLAYALAAHFPDGVLWVDLENAVTDNQLNVSAIQSDQKDIIQHFGRELSEEYDPATRSRILREVLANKRVLLILDNAHGTEDVINFLPPNTSGCATLITTRNRRMLRDRASSSFDVTTFTDKESINLLERCLGTERVRQELQGAEQIISLVGGLPLALKIIASDLAESEVTFLEYYELLIEERLRLNTLADWEDTSKDVRASFELSYHRLPADFQTYFAALSVFEGVDFSAEAAAAVIDQPVPRTKIQILGRFQDLSLLEKSQNQADPQAVRYRLHPLLRLFAREKLSESDMALGDLQARAMLHYIEMASEPQQTMQRLDADRENIMAALRWAQALADWPHFQQGVAALTHPSLGVVGYLDARGFWQEATQLLTTLLAGSTVEADVFQKAMALYKLGTFYLRLAQADQAEAHLKESLSLLPVLPADEPARLLEAHLCESLSQLYLARGKIDSARQWIEQGLAALQPLNSDNARHETGYLYIRQVPVLARSGQWQAAIIAGRQGLALLPPHSTAARVSGLTNLGILHDIQGETEQALTCWQQGVQQAQVLGDNRRLAQLWQNMSVAQANAGRFVQALPLAEKALAAYERIGDMAGAATIHSNLAEIRIYLQQYEAAEAHLSHSLTLARQLALPRTEVFALVNQARWYLDKQQLAAAQAALQQAEQIRQKASEPLQEAEIYRLQAELAFYQGKPGEALKQLEVALAVATEHGEWKEQGIAWRLQGDIWRAQGRLDEAEEAYQHSLDIMHERNRFETARTQLALGQLYAQSKRAKQARTLLEAALATFTKLQMPHFANLARQAYH